MLVGCLLYYVSFLLVGFHFHLMLQHRHVEVADILVISIVPHVAIAMVYCKIMHYVVSNYNLAVDLRSAKKTVPAPKTSVVARIPTVKSCPTP